MTYKQTGLFIELENLETFAESVAKSLSPQGCKRGIRASKELISRLREIRQIHDRVQNKYDSGEMLPEAAEWLLDNWYLIQREGKVAAGELKGAKRLRLESQGELLIIELASALVRSGQGVITKERCETFLTGFQNEVVLSRSELSIFIYGVKAALIIELKRLCMMIEASAQNEDLGKDIGKLISSLRLLGNLDLSETMERVDHTEQILRRDPAGIYPYMDEKTRDNYRLRVSRLAKKNDAAEHRIAQRVLRLSQSATGQARHVGYYLFTMPLGESEKQSSGGMYIALNVLLTAFLTLFFGFLTESIAAAFLLLIPVSELVKNLIDFVALRIYPPRHVPRMELRGGVPNEGRTLCVISALFTDDKSGPHFSRLMEEYRLSNRDAGSNLLFGVLADLPESPDEHLPGSDRWIASAAKEIEKLNEKYGGGFYLLTRDRVLSKADGRYMGWERKRGAILELARLLGGKKSSIKCPAGDAKRLEDVKYILTLDSDTRLCPGTARELIGAMLHPLNTPVVNKKRKIVTSGTAIIQPRMAVELHSARRSDFSRIFAGQGGTDPYGFSCGEVYMDLFGHGSFAGKGIIDVKVFLQCLEDKIPENTVLSHDILEGAYLHGAYMGDVELTDCYPSRVMSYYGRMNRWTRGDWQNIPWLFKRGRDLKDIDRWKLFDNLRRSLTSPMTFAAIFTGFLIPRGGILLAAIAALLSVASQLLLMIAETAFRPEEESKVRYHSTIIHGVGGGFLQTACRLVLLPYEAWVSITAIAASLWRMTVSHKNMLLWQTAAQSDSSGGKSIPAHYMKMWIILPVSAACFVFSTAIMGFVAGIFWLFSPVYAVSLSRDRWKKRKPSESEREYLLGCAKDIWRFFEAFVTEKDNYLPPDNWQEQPPVGIAHRTSPTNIGLCLLTCISAIDLKLCEKEKALDLIEKTITTIEKLPKWNGHLYNWYDTRTLNTLHPEYVSTVDSGNLAGCLLALSHALREYDREDLAARCDAIMSPMSFVPLYDPSRRLFHIGWDASKNEATEGWYDLLASEARLSGYVAIAKGDVERRHWRRLGRALVSKDGFRGMASWTGTMFEYLMPELLMPVYADSLLYESAKFCVYVQKKRTDSKTPWGISESAFYSLDSALSYRYKAHGCQGLALKRGMDKELVISPYSTFLALPVEPRGVIKNLKLLESFGVRGKYGFWEAIDFTPSRIADKKPEIVRCVMAHHIGMSIISITNYLCDGIMPKRFMKNPSMSAFAGLLQEKVPIGGVLLQRRDRELPEKPVRASASQWIKKGTDIDPINPACCLLSNGAYNLLVTESGICRSTAGELGIYKSPARQIGESGGSEIYYVNNNKTNSLLPYPQYQEDISYDWEFSSSRAIINSKGDDFSSSVHFAVSPTEQGELRRIFIKSDTGFSADAELIIRLEPVLAFLNDYVNHPAFYKLGMEAYLTHNEDALILRRLKRGRLAECFLCVKSTGEMKFQASKDEDQGLGFQYEPQITGRLKLYGNETETALAICLGSTEEEAIAGANHLLSMTPAEYAGLPLTCASLFGMSGESIENAMSIIPQLAFPSTMRLKKKDDDNVLSYPKDHLWRFGISGDVPIVCSKIGTAEIHEKAEELIKHHSLLNSCGIKYDLVFLTDEGGDYHRPHSTALWDSLRRLGRESFAGIKGGIHFVDSSMDASSIISTAALLTDKEGNYPKADRLVDYNNIMSINRQRNQNIPEFDWDKEGRFSFYVNHSLPPRSWGNFLGNGNFGYFSTDCGTGHMWYKNAREFPISPWLNDPMATTGAETLEIIIGDSRHSLFASPEDRDCKVSFDLGSTTWEKSIDGAKIKTTAFVPTDIDARVFIVEYSGKERAKIAWFTQLVMSGNAGDYTQVSTAYNNGVFSAKNARSQWQDTKFHAAAGREADVYTCDRFAWLSGRPEGESGVGYDPCFGAIYPADDCLVLVCGCDDPGKLIQLCKPDAAFDSLSRTLSHWRELSSPLSIKTPDKDLDRLVNYWLPYQTMACRVLGRSSIYQSGGAYGFRDQLQDLTNMILLSPDAARNHIIECCSKQFEEGDVQHWWHPGESVDKGVRTRITDDLLWLPWALCEYVDKTGDESILVETAPYLKSPILSDNEHERYEAPEVSSKTESVILHAQRAIDLIIKRGHGSHGLILMGTGDWNDGMDKVGAEGSGESVWLSWFFAITARRFASLLTKNGDNASASRILKAASKYGSAANAAWDGNWYRRGYFDDGTPLGSHENKCCQIDSIAQSFSAFCNEAEEKRVNTALDNAINRLLDRENKLLRLFTPPFLDHEPNPGYIQSYGPGFRENGGQYTHGAVWMSMACLHLGRIDEGYELLRTLMPTGRDVKKYGAEPFVMSADVYSAPGLEGKAGWSWYTGSAGWFYRIAVEELLGLRLVGGQLLVQPRLPSGWDSFQAKWKDPEGNVHTIDVSKNQILVNGESYEGQQISPKNASLKLKN